MVKNNVATAAVTNAVITDTDEDKEAVQSFMEWKPSESFDPSTFEFGKVLGSLRRKLKGTHEQIHLLAVTAIYYAQVFNNYDMAGRLMTALAETPTVRKAGIDVWFKNNSNIKFTTVGLVVKANKDTKADNPCDWEKAYRLPFWLDDRSNEEVKIFNSGNVFAIINNAAKRLDNILKGEVKGTKADEHELQRLRFLSKSMHAFLATIQRETETIPLDGAANETAETVEDGLADTVKVHDADETRIAANG